MKKHGTELFSSLGCIMLDMLSGWTAYEREFPWYDTLVKPSFTPPDWFFTPVWTFLYSLMGVIFIKIVKLRNTKLLLLFILQFFCNIIWSYLFFGMHRIDLALYDCILLWLLLTILLIKSFLHKSIFWLLLPYELWTTFALILNIRIYMLNIV